MRFNQLARRISLAPALGLALALAVAACSSSSSSPAPASASSAPASSSSAPATPASSSATGSANAVALITTDWETFFNGKTTAAKRIALLQNGQQFASVIKAQSGSSLASGASAKVTKVVVTSPAKATVTYNVLLNGTPALSNQTGTAVYQNGTWKVGDVSFCGLLTLENGGKAPSVCSSAG